MKRKLITLGKGILFIAMFMVIYAWRTHSVDQSKITDIQELSDEWKPLHQQYKTLLVKTLPDSMAITDFRGFRVASDSAYHYKYKPIAKFLLNQKLNKKVVVVYMTKFIQMSNARHEAEYDITEYKLDRIRLYTRFPSNLVLTANNFKPIQLK